MEKSKLVYCFEEQLSAFNRYFEATVQQHVVEDIHELRVSIKNIRALLILTELASAGVFTVKDHFRMLKPLFKAAGKVREIQINLEILAEKYPDEMPGFIDYLKKKEEVYIQKLLKEAELFDFSKMETENELQKAAMNALPESLVIKDADVFINKKLRKIEALTKKKHNDEKLHEVRRHLKPVTEILALMIEINPEGQDLKGLKHELKDLYKKIGEWHDQSVLAASMKKFNKLKTAKSKDPGLKSKIKMLDQKNRKSSKLIYGLLDKLPDLKTLNRNSSMKNLVIVRHAKAESHSGDIPDMDRKLTGRGKKDAEEVAKLMKMSNVIPDMILSSPAKRAQQTAMIFAEILEVDKDSIATPELLYGYFGKDELKTLLKEVAEKKDTVYIFGHNPVLSVLVADLTGSNRGELPTSGTAVIEYDIESWDDIDRSEGNLLMWEFPF